MTIVSKIPKLGILGPKFKDFYFCTKLSNKANSRALISIMTIVFSNSFSKIPKSGIFKYDNSFSKLLSNTPKIRNAFCPQFKAFFHKTLHLEKFKVASVMKVVFLSNVGLKILKYGNFVHIFKDSYFILPSPHELLNIFA